MIAKYEIEIIEYLKRAIPSLKQTVYAEKEELFEVFNASKLTPAFYYNRTAELNTLSKIIKIPSFEPRTEGQIEAGTKSVTSFYPLPFNYKGYILVEKQIDLQTFMADLRFYWGANPYLYIQYLAAPEEPIPVGLRLLYIKIEEIRSNQENKGPLRCIEFSWNSQLFISKEEALKLFTKINVIVNSTVNKEFDLPNK